MTDAVKDPLDKYDSEHGKPEEGKDHECVDLSEESNKEPPQDKPFKGLSGS